MLEKLFRKLVLNCNISIFNNGMGIKNKFQFWFLGKTKTGRL